LKHCFKDDEKFCLKTRLSFKKDTFLYSFGFLKQMAQSNGKKSEKYHMGAVIKVPKKCHVLFEWPLNIIRVVLITLIDHNLHFFYRQL
jgi:hypothetical protein